jgi:ubiquinone/menaquinone biosynthesis C-methylase UbiE
MSRYSEIHGKSSRLPARRFGYYHRLNLIRDTLKAYSTPHTRLLDIGSAHGDYVWDFAQEGWEVTCLDINLERLKDGKQLNPKIAFVSGDGQKLPFSSHSFDVVTILNTLRYIPAPSQALLESSRVLRGGGGLVLIDHNKLSLDTLWARNPEVMRLFSIRGLRQMLSQSNFQILKAKYLFIPPASTPRQCLGIVPKLGVLLSSLGLSWIFPEIFIYAVKVEAKNE